MMIERQVQRWIEYIRIMFKKGNIKRNNLGRYRKMLTESERRD